MQRIQGLGRAVLVVGAISAVAACADGARDVDDTVALGADSSVVVTGDVARDSMGNITTMSEANIFELLSVANTGEIEYSRAAVDKLTNADLKAFARQMITDHQTMLDEGKALAGRLNVTPASTDRSRDLQEEVNEDLTDLRAKTGRDFDREFIEEQIDMHQETLDMLEDLDDDTNNAELNAAIEKAKPMVRQHLERAKQLKERIDA
jgi:putative membrane protein